MRVPLASVAMAVAADVVEAELNSVPFTPELTVIVPLPLVPMILPSCAWSRERACAAATDSCEANANTRDGVDCTTFTLGDQSSCAASCTYTSLPTACQATSVQSL